MAGAEPHTWRADLMDNITFVGLNVHEARVCAAVAESGHDGEVRQIGIFENRPDVFKKIVNSARQKWLAA